MRFVFSFFFVIPIAHVVKVLCELSQVRTLLLILLLGPKQNFGNLKENTEESRAQSWD